jgi:hypothetical protein
MDIYGSPSLIGPIAPIIGAVVGSLITAAIAYYVLAKRRRVLFTINEAEDLTLPLRQENQNRLIVFTIDNRSVFNFNRCVIDVRNTGNTPIEDFKFEVDIPGMHEFAIVDPICELRELREAIKVSSLVVGGSNTFAISVPFFNAREEFALYVLFDNATENCVVRCRLPDVSVRIKEDATKERELNADQLRLWGLIIAATVSTLGAVVGLKKLF